jgi:hypothetical protein
MRKKIRTLALAVVAIGGGALAGPGAAYATYVAQPVVYCCCEAVYGVCVNRCCSPRGCTITAQGCITNRM